MLENASNADLLIAWKHGDQQAAQILVRRYMARLTAFARSRLSRKLSRRLDPEDVVLSAWRSFFVGMDLGRLAVPADDNLWPLLVAMTHRKLSRQANRHAAGRRSVANEAELDWEEAWNNAIASEPTAEDAAILVEQVESLLAVLEVFDRNVLSLRLQGENAREIAQALHSSERTVRRSLKRIAEFISKNDQHDSASGQGEPPLLAASLKSHDQSPALPHDATPPPLQGATVHYENFRLEKMIGSGGFGRVYRAFSAVDETFVAVKYLRKRFWKDPHAVQSMLEESRRVSGLLHPNIVQHRGWGVSPQGAVFLVMDWVEGLNLRTWMQAAPPPLSEILRCGIDVAQALRAAHAQGVIHGDVTDANVLRRHDGAFLLTDFGFARSLQDQTIHQMMGGTPGFLAPEQVSEAFGTISERTDVYGLGGLIYSLVTSRPPATGNDVAEVLANVLRARPHVSAGELHPGLPQDLDRLLARCLEKEPCKRPTSIGDVSDDLQQILNAL